MEKFEKLEVFSRGPGGGGTEPRRSDTPGRARHGRRGGLAQDLDRPQARRPTGGPTGAD